jgi:hypothetical protein
LAAAIESAFTIKAALIDGHNGIYKVSIDNKVVYTNEGQCCQGFPNEEQIVEQVGQFIGITPKLNTQSASVSDQERGPACPLPGKTLPTPEKKS